MDINRSIKKLATYALEKGLITTEEMCYSINLLLDVLNLDEYDDPEESYRDVELEPEAVLCGTTFAGEG